ncbi:MAG: DUF2267 domain-containing protein [Candidatus Omnitrophica bacterium]|nr:DUF2267 domain-containing protein [Candidatus Omnitrophota bacterium]MDE2222240.1 DUF2267 domain-containing protein [Candidatus Omnitrophota bacterium]
MIRINSRQAAKHRKEVHHLDKTLMKANEWLKEIQNELHLEGELDAYASLRAVLHGLRDHLSTDEVAQLGAQLPVLIRGVYYEGWDPRPKPERVHNPQQFIDEIKKHIREGLNPTYVTEGILRFLENRMGEGEINSIKRILPHLWPAGIREGSVMD